MTAGPGRRGAIAFFVTLGASLVVLATALNVGWIVLNRQNIAPLLFGVFVLAAIIAGLILNTTFLVREIRRNEQHDAFVNAVTHELKTPITSIRLHLDTLSAHDLTLSPEKRREFYGIMRDDSDRLMHTIEQVLRTGQAEHIPLHRARVDLRALAEECVAFTRTRFRLDDDAIRFVSAADSDVAVIGDAGLLRGAALNLIDNAVKYSSLPVRVDVSVTREGGRALLRVRDYGVGLAPDELKRIFRRVKGAGLGLFIVRSAARRHGGRAFAESNGPGTGATFSLELPAAPAATP